MEPTLRQGCVVAVSSDEEDTYVAMIGKEEVSWLNPIRRKPAIGA